MTCVLCGQELKRLGLHLKYKHPNVSHDDYYLNHVYKERPKCKCGKLLEFRGPKKGFARHCSVSCSSTDPDVIAKIPPRNPKSEKKRAKALRKFLSDPNNFTKRQKQRYKYKKVTVDGREFEVQGYEPFFLQELSSFGLTVDDIQHPAPPIKYRLGKRWRTYHPDFYVPKLNTMVEVKSAWTMKRNKKMNRAKWSRARMLGYVMLVLVYDSEGRRISG